MDHKTKQEKEAADPKIEDLPSDVRPATADNVKGGLARRSGDDEDDSVNDFEPQR